MKISADKCAYEMATKLSVKRQRAFCCSDHFRPRCSVCPVPNEKERKHRLPSRAYRVDCEYKQG